MSRAVLVVDGTNVSWAWPRSRPHMVRSEFAKAQLLLFEALVGSPLRTVHRELVLVFDGPPTRGGPSSTGGALVLHPDVGSTADDRILELIGQRRHAGQAISLASSDRQLRDLARALGATTMGAMELLSLLDHTQSRSSGTAGRPGGQLEKPSPSQRDTEAWLRRFSSSRAPGQKEGDSR
jgi:predicted RNA-binding protein with PIN domain